ncbi:hypothetical protein B0T21DRAFT_360514 [Apiosordaria backusii]|uniref:Uncharacterized protein n=1 Tax=Apiosordaria backusii TaxID=314023 RepID=A0AA40EMD7_9PEZI|nr:hypothetical protein B0T21DRAFT_360514 [Apiosordaria backusii]
MTEIIPLLENLRDNSTALRTIPAPSWLDNPGYRGTASILWSCLVTLVACVYSAIHLNVPAPGKSGQWAVLGIKSFWVLMALAVPEAVVVTAFGQFLKAWWLRHELRSLQTSNSNGNSHSSVSLRYCFFVVMGGVRYRLDDVLDEDETKHLEDKIQESTAVLSPEAVLQLARLGHVLDIPDTTIDDRSKASIIQKCLVLVQVFWMALQCIVRLAYGFPLALLEVHVMVHVLCAAIMYAFWLKKPLDVLEPVMINSSDLDNVLLLMLELEVLKPPHPLRKIFVHPRLSASDGRPLAPVEAKVHLGSFDFKNPISNKMEKMNWVALPPTGGRILRNEALACGLSFSGATYLGPRRMKRLECVARLLDDLEKGERRTGELSQLYPNEFYHIAFAKPGSNTNFDAPTRMGSLRGSKFTPLPNSRIAKVLDSLNVIGLVVLPALYGGIHLSTWNYSFASARETEWWRISCLVVVGGMLPWVIAWGILATLLKIFCGDSRDDSIRFPIIMVGFLANAVCRGYIVVESFISLRASPIGVYLTPPWIQMLPHF